MTTILALDIASHLGWAFGSDASEGPAFGSVQLGGNDASHPARFAAALRWAVAEFKNHPPDILAIEAALQVQAFGRKNHASAVLQFGYHAIVRAVAFECGIHNIQEHNVADVRGLFIGHRHLKREVAKPAAVKRCHQLGWMVVDHDQADACAIWTYQCALLNWNKILNRIAQCGIVTITEPKKSTRQLPKKLRMRAHLTT